jgi:hypothetical protein
MTALASNVVAVRERQVRVAALLCLTGVVGAVVYLAIQGSPGHGDSRVLVRGASGIADCLRHRRFTSCDRFVVHGRTGDRTILVGAFPLLQYLPAVTLQFLGASRDSTLRALVILNAMSLIAILYVARTTVKRLAPPMWVPLVTVALIASPLLWYGRIALGEELSAAVILAAVAAVLLRARLPIIVLFVVMACIAKETNPPFVFALTAICTLARTDARDSLRRRQLFAILVGTMIGFACNCAFNVMRFGTVRNTLYTQGALHTTNLGVVARQFSALWFSPNGGITWFWPCAPLLVFAIAIASYRRERLSWRSVGVLVVSALLIGELAVLSTWFSPFGWYAWGPRLTLPLVPALIVTACVLGAARATRFVSGVLRSLWVLPTSGIVIALGLPEAVVLFHGLAISEFFARKAGTGCVSGGVFVDPTHYYRCQIQAAWSKRPWMLQVAMHGLRSAQGWFMTIAFVGAVVSLLYTARLTAPAE